MSKISFINYQVHRVSCNSCVLFIAKVIITCIFFLAPLRFAVYVDTVVTVAVVFVVLCIYGRLLPLQPHSYFYRSHNFAPHICYIRYIFIYRLTVVQEINRIFSSTYDRSPAKIQQLEKKPTVNSGDPYKFVWPFRVSEAVRWLFLAVANLLAACHMYVYKTVCILIWFLEK